MAEKGHIRKDYDVVNSPPPSLSSAAEYFENTGIQPPSGELRDAGWDATNTTEPKQTPSSIPSYSKGSGY